jgi:broad specificity phosphatase PhoE
MASLIFITHPEVVIDPARPIPEWPLNATGRARMERFAGLLADRAVSAVYASTERKAMDGAAILADSLGLSCETDEDLGENDRSATGYIAPPEFWDVVREFFGRPHESIRGWERAVDAQTRIVTATRRILREDETSDDIVVVSHGAVGCLLTAHLQKVEIGQESRPQHPGGGCFIVIDRDSFTLTQDWRAIEDGSRIENLTGNRHTPQPSS